MAYDNDALAQRVALLRGLADGDARKTGWLMPEESLTLVRANKSRGGGHWSADDYDVYAGRRVIGRIMVHPQAPRGRSWFWTITARERRPSLDDRGYSASREEAMADFKARWSAA